MRHLFTKPKWTLTALLAALALLSALAPAQVSWARPPLQEGGQPDFEVTVQTSPDGQATIASQETSLDAAYFAANGTMTGVSLTPAGLALADGAAEGAYESGVIVSPLSFTTDIVPLWRVELPEGAELRLETRLSSDGGASWSEWLENPEAYYPVRDDMHSGNLIWAGSPQAALQFRLTLRGAAPGVSPTVSNLTLVFSDTSQGPTDGEIAGQMAQAAASNEICPVEKPPVVSRTGWGCPDGQLSPRRPPAYAPVTHIIIHQAETPNATTPYMDWAGWVRSVWNYHANVLRWGDVGYNYLIDPTGTIYEGRAGGDNVVGIHDTHNRGSMAIGFLGCYGACDDPRLSVAEPSEAMLASAVELMAWKADQAGLDPLGSGPYDTLASVPTIAGGRDVVPTTSPGDNLYDQLPTLREAVAARLNQCQQLQACQVTDVIFDQAEYDVNDPIRLTLKLADPQGQPLGGALVSYDVMVSETVTGLAAAQAITMTDRTGDYDSVYTTTQVAGQYLFTFSASDPTGTKFAPCTAERTVLVREGTVPPPQCLISDVVFDQAQYSVGNTINLTATVVDPAGDLLNGATVTATVLRPDSGSDLIALLGSGQYTGSYSNTVNAGDYNFEISAVDPTQALFSSCTTERAVTVISSTVQPCTITAEASPATLSTLGEAVTLRANVSLAGPISDATVVARVARPGGAGPVDVTLPALGDGAYEQAFSDTGLPGTYNFTVSATGQGFAACNTNSSFSVVPTGTIVIIQPTTTHLCAGSSTTTTTQVRVNGVSNLQGYSFFLDFDPAVVQVIDADPTTPQTQIRVGSTFSGNTRLIPANSVADGRVDFGAVLINAFSGDGILAEIDWAPVGEGNAALTLSEVKLANPNGQAIAHQVVSGSIEVAPCAAANFSGQVRLQGRNNHGGVTISADQTGQALTGPDGTFTINAGSSLRLNLPGYLSAQADVAALQEQASAAGPVNLGTITLLAGDVTGDDQVNIFDLAYMATRYGSTDLSADLNLDGRVDILDLAMAAGNYGRQGPLTTWQ